MHRFVESPRGHGNVVFNFRGRAVDDLSAFAEGYHMAGKTLADKLGASSGYVDYEGYPILFLYRHSLELYMKAVVYRGALLLGLISQERLDTTELFKRHELTRLLRALRTIFLAQKWGFDGTELTSFDDFAELIHTLDEIDPQSYSFRYPVTRTAAPQLPHHFVLNVATFAAHMDPVLQLLDGCVCALHEEFDIQAELRYEFQQFFEEGGDA